LLAVLALGDQRKKLLNCRLIISKTRLDGNRNTAGVLPQAGGV
jgi:hypothetical protein